MEWFKIVLENILPVLFTILVPIMVVLGRWFIRYLEKKLDFDMAQETEAQLMGYIRQGISYAEEKALAAVEVDPQDMTPGQAKLNNALGYVREQVERQGWDELAGEKLARLIEAALNQARLRGDVPPSKPSA